MADTRGTLLAAAFAGLVAGCGSVAAPEPPEPLEELPRDLSPAELSLVSSGNAFGFDLFSRLASASPAENVVASPLSAYLALGMTANAADGKTLAEMRATLRQEALTEEEANAAFRDLMTLLLGLDGGVEVALANSVWYRDGFPIRPGFVDLSREFFDAEVRGLDFAAPDAPDVINDWVSGETGGRIEDLIREIRSEEVAFLINALYFKGAWRNRFRPSETREAPFRRPDGSTVTVPLMTRTGSVRLASDGEVRVVELLYGRGAFAFTVVLPPEGTSPAELASSLDASVWGRWVGDLAESEATVQLPRFRLAWEERLDRTLKAMGMPRAFDEGEADLSRMVQEGATLPGRLFISRVQQKTFVDVNEEGTEAAAATSVGVGVTSAPPTIRVDRPFLFAIRERFSGTILFLGQVTDPTA